MVAPPENLELWLETADGTTTHFCGGQYEGQEGVTLAYTPTGSAFADVFEAPFTTIYNSAAFEVGGRYGGMNEDMFDFSLVFTIKATANMTFRQTWTRFRKRLKADVDSFMHARIQGVSHRKLTVRLKKTSNLKTDVDPNGQKFGQVVVYFVGAYPRWVEADYTSTWVTQNDTTGLAAPTVNTPTTSTTGGTLAAATYYYKVTTKTGTGESAGSTEVHIATTGTTSKNTLTWTAVSGASGYNIYRSTATGTEKILTAISNPATTTFVDDGSLTPGTTSVPTTSTTTNPDTGYVTVVNPTNSQCWLKWMAQAGNANVQWTIPDFSWGSDAWNRATIDATRMIIMPELVNGENIAVDTNPYAFSGQVNSSLDTAVYLRMNGVQFLYPLPANTPPTQIPVQVSHAQPGNGIQVRCPLEWTHPWGGE